MQRYHIKGFDKSQNKQVTIESKGTSEDEAQKRVADMFPEVVIESVQLAERNRSQGEKEIDFEEFKRRAIEENPSLARASNAHLLQRYRRELDATSSERDAPQHERNTVSLNTHASYPALRNLAGVYLFFAIINAVICTIGAAFAFTHDSIGLGVTCVAVGLLGTLFLVACSEGIKLALDAQGTLLEIRDKLSADQG